MLDERWGSRRVEVNAGRWSAQRGLVCAVCLARSVTSVRLNNQARGRRACCTALSYMSNPTHNPNQLSTEQQTNIQTNEHTHKRGPASSPTIHELFDPSICPAAAASWNVTPTPGHPPFDALPPSLEFAGTRIGCEWV